MSKINRYAAISKIEDNDDGTITVYGVASTEAVDAHGEIITKDAMANAIPDFMKYGTGALRSMHQPIAAGTVTKATVNDAGQTEIEAIVVDPVEITKVKTGTYKGFSVGGNQVPGGYDKVTKTITAMTLTEISLVDRPANPEAVITMFKLEDAPAAAEPTVVVPADQADAATALADILNKGDLSAARLVELAQAEIAKSADPVVEPAAAAPAAEPAAADPVVEPAAPAAEGEVGKAAGATIQKGMYGVSRFADLLTSLGYLT